MADILAGVLAGILAIRADEEVPDVRQNLAAWRKVPFRRPPTLPTSD
jgi:hypothetical protein